VRFNGLYIGQKDIVVQLVLLEGQGPYVLLFIQLNGIRGKNMPSRLPSATMFGLVEVQSSIQV
jgi:hypothetical protein